MNTDTALKQPIAPSIDAIKARQKATWEDGNYVSFAKFMEAGAIEILNGWQIAKGLTLLDVGCGSGQTAIPAAKNGSKVTGIDVAENLIRHARQRATEAGLEVRFDVGDAEDLPYASNSFDVVISLIGAMFAPRPEVVASEFARVLKSGGKLFMANWTQASMPGRMFKCISEFVPPPPGLVSPVLWGDEATVKQRLSNDFTDIQLTRKIYPQWHYSFDAAELVNLFRTLFGPVKKAFDTIDPQQQMEFRNRLEQIYRDTSKTTNGVLTITKGEYLEVVAIRR